MIQVDVNMDESGAMGVLRKLQWIVHGRGASAVMGEACAELTRAHLFRLAARRHRPGMPHNFYARAAGAVVSEPVYGGAQVIIPHEGLALRYYGGTVRPSGRISLVTGRPIRRLAVPKKGSGAQGKTPAEFKDLFVLKLKRKAVLAVRGPGGMVRVLFRLLERTEHKPDPSVMPTDAEFRKAGAEALDELLAETIDGIGR
jgi:hypothetical protein